MIRRREFITLLGGATIWPFVARAQQGDRVRRIGVLTPLDENDAQQKRRLSAFTQALAGLGWTDGRNMRIDLRWHGGDTNRIRAIAQELVSLQPDIIVTLQPATRHHRDTRDRGDRCPPAGDADDPDRLYGGGRSRRQRPRR
jgi:putative ABC transport system substrate-binding protein